MSKLVGLDRLPSGKVYTEEERARLRVAVGRHVDFWKKYRDSSETVEDVINSCEFYGDDPDELAEGFNKWVDNAEEQERLTGKSWPEIIDERIRGGGCNG